MIKNIKSNLVLKNIFSHLKKRKKLIIVKHNKKIQELLNLYKKDFFEFYSLQQLNIKFGLKLRDIETESLNLENKNLDGKKLKDINKINFTNLKEVNLSLNKI